MAKIERPPPSPDRSRVIGQAIFSPPATLLPTAIQARLFLHPPEKARTLHAWLPTVFGMAAATDSGAIQTFHWAAFAVFVVVMLTLDLTVFHKHAHEPSLSESAFWTCFWSALALSFNAIVWWWLGGKAAIEFLTGYLVEWSLSMDNVFVFAVVFAYFGVPLKYQYRVLFWGILGAVLMRLTFVIVGAELVERFSWILWVFGGFLVYTGIKLAFGDKDHDPGDNFLIKPDSWLTTMRIQDNDCAAALPLGSRYGCFFVIRHWFPPLRFQK